MIIKFLKKALEQKELISITTKDIEWDESIIGYVTEIEDAYFSMNEIDEFGELIGNTTFAIDEVLCVQPDDFYLREMRIIHKNRLSFNPDLKVSVRKKGKDLIPYFEKIREEEQITRFLFEEDNIAIGIVLDFDDDFLLIKNIGYNGQEEGITCYRINDITGLGYGGISQQRIKLLYDNASNKLNFTYTQK